MILPIVGANTVTTTYFLDTIIEYENREGLLVTSYVIVTFCKSALSGRVQLRAYFGPLRWDSPARDIPMLRAIFVVLRRRRCGRRFWRRRIDSDSLCRRGL